MKTQSILLVNIGFSDLSQEHILLRVPKDLMDKAQIAVYETSRKWISSDDRQDLNSFEEELEKELKRKNIPYVIEEFDVVDLEFPTFFRNAKAGMNCG